MFVGDTNLWRRTKLMMTESLTLAKHSHQNLPPLDRILVAAFDHSIPFLGDMGYPWVIPGLSSLGSPPWVLLPGSSLGDMGCLVSRFVPLSSGEI